MFIRCNSLRSLTYVSSRIVESAPYALRKATNRSTSLTVLINFTLAPLEKIVPWGTPGNYRLHWFGLTDGEYWISAGEATLFEYSEQVQAAGANRYCDYQVVRLYEDLIDMLPYVLEPVPKSLMQYVCGETARAWQKTYSDWCDKNYDVLDPSHINQIVDLAVVWTGKRSLDSAYLSPSANIAIWSDDENVHIEWDNRDRLYEGKPAWTALFGAHRMPRREFVEEIRSFHLRLMAQMSVRIQQVQEGALSSDIEIDLPGLLKEQAQRSRSLDTALNVSPQTNWKEVERVICEISGI